tara:strand:- start:482 stop:673 length:192 start_codon:yes stop_codon:yes gene_type:complete
MEVDQLGHIRWGKKDFKKHGTIAKYLIGECRCKKCKTRFFDWGTDDKLVHAAGQARKQLFPRS